VSARAAEPSWALTWEDDLTADEHGGIATLLAQAFPRSRTGFTGTRSWSSGRPELRLVAWRDGRAVAHLGILRRFLRVPERAASVLVGDVGLVAVAPQERGTGLGRELLRRGDDVLRRLDVPFGYLTCGEHVAAFYQGCGWVRASGGTRMIRADGRVQVYGGASMVREVRASLADWPDGCLVDRNGLEI
jgi:nodulation protein A